MYIVYLYSGCNGYCDFCLTRDACNCKCFCMGRMLVSSCRCCICSCHECIPCKLLELRFAWLAVCFIGLLAVPLHFSSQCLQLAISLLPHFWYSISSSVLCYFCWTLNLQLAFLHYQCTYGCCNSMTRCLSIYAGQWFNMKCRMSFWEKKFIVFFYVFVFTDLTMGFLVSVSIPITYSCNAFILALNHISLFHELAILKWDRGWENNIEYWQPSYMSH